MKWIEKIRVVTASISCSVMVLSPLAQGAEAANATAKQLEYRRNLVKMVATEFGVGDKTPRTYGDLYARTKLIFPADMRKQMDDWMAVYRSEPLPKMEISSFKDKDGNEQFRFYVTRKGESFTLSTGMGFIQIGSQKVLVKDFDHPAAALDKVLKNDPYFRAQVARGKSERVPISFVVSKTEYEAMSPEKRSLYFLQIRNLMAEANKIIEDSRARKSAAYIEGHLPAYALMAHWVFGDNAVCADLSTRKTKRSGGGGGGEQIPARGSSCIVAGWVTNYDDNGGSCGGAPGGDEKWRQQIASSAFSSSVKCANAGEQPCNPIVYGFDGGNAFCVPGDKESMRSATARCDKKSPLEPQRIVQSWMDAQGKHRLKFDRDGKVSAADYEQVANELVGLKKIIADANSYCTDHASRPVKKQRPEQTDGCDNLLKRAFDIDTMIVKANHPPPMDNREIACVQRGGTWEPESSNCRKCVVPPQVELPLPRGNAEEGPPPPLPGPVGKDNGWNFDWMSGGIGALAGIVVAGGIACFAGVLTFSMCQPDKKQCYPYQGYGGGWMNTPQTTCLPYCQPGTPIYPTTPTTPVTPVTPVIIPGEGGTVIQPINSGGVIRNGNR